MRQPAQPSSSDLVLLGEVIRAVVRRGRLPPADAEDFSQGVQLKFLESGYEAFARFDGRSSLRTYLTTVVWRLLLDWRTAAYGKWRPSAVARRLGAQAVRLDRLLNRDGLTVDEAIQVASRAPDASPEHVLRLIAIACRGGAGTWSCLTTSCSWSRASFRIPSRRASGR